MADSQGLTEIKSFPGQGSADISFFSFPPSFFCVRKSPNAFVSDFFFLEVTCPLFTVLPHSVPRSAFSFASAAVSVRGVRWPARF